MQESKEIKEACCSLTFHASRFYYAAISDVFSESFEVLSSEGQPCMI